MGVLPFLFFKATFWECDRYFVLFLHVCFLYQLLFPLTLYSLPESLSDAFLGWFGVSEMGCAFKLCNNKAIFILRSHTKGYLSTQKTHPLWKLLTQAGRDFINSKAVRH